MPRIVEAVESEARTMDAAMSLLTHVFAKGHRKLLLKLIRKERWSELSTYINHLAQDDPPTREPEVIGAVTWLITTAAQSRSLHDDEIKSQFDLGDIYRLSECLLRGKLWDEIGPDDYDPAKLPRWLKMVDA